MFLYGLAENYDKITNQKRKQKLIHYLHYTTKMFQKVEGMTKSQNCKICKEHYTKILF